MRAPLGDKQSTDALVKEALYLRYGSEAPCKVDRPPALLTEKTVARLMKLSVTRVHGLLVRYFRPLTVPKRFSVQPPKLNAAPMPGQRVQQYTIRHNELEFLLDPDTHRDWAHFSLAQRCVMFHRRFPDRWLQPWDLSKIMREAGMRKKRVSVTRAPAKFTQRLEKFDREIVALCERVEGIIAKGGHLVFADEAIFAARGFQMKAWSLPNETIHVSDRSGNQPCQAVCAAVCACHGLLTYEVEDYSFDAAKFTGFLRSLRAAQGVGDERLYLFLDNCSVHHALLVAPEFEALNIEPVWNVAYHYMYNAAVERYWAQLKAYFRPLLLQKMLRFPKPKEMPLRDAVLETIRKVPDKSIPAFVEHGLRELRKDAAYILAERDGLDAPGKEQNKHR